MCILLANMQNASVAAINHIRIMIEEEEMRKFEDLHKLFVLVLHFPRAQFFQHCYPTLFLKGWDHCYLDTLAHSTAEGVVNIQDWLFECFLHPLGYKQNTLIEALENLLPQVIPVLSARICFGNKDDGSFNSKMNASQRSDALKILLKEKGVREVLCRNFCALWTPRVMTEYLERAANFSKQRESTLNITDSIQTKIRSLFITFCVLVLSKANENYNLDVIYAAETGSATHQLFNKILAIFFSTNLKQLHHHIEDFPAAKDFTHSPHFPFFNLIYNLVEKQIEPSKRVANQQLDVLSEKQSVQDPSLEGRLHELTKAVCENLKALNVSAVSITRLERALSDSLLLKNLLIELQSNRLKNFTLQVL